MGANNSTRRVSFESDENDNVTIVKGIRLSENVINRMKETSGPLQTPPPAKPTPSVPQPFKPISSLPSHLPPEPVGSSAPVTPSPPAEPVASPPKVDESKLREKMTEELQRGLEEERNRSWHELHQWLEKERAQLQAQALVDAQDKVSRTLATDRVALEDSLHHAALRERIAVEKEKARTQSKQLEARERALRKQEAFYREQVAKLEERSVQSSKVTSENFHKAVDEMNAKFRRYEISPVCADLQDQIVKCYRENVGKTLHCSNIASLYLQCVNNAKQKELSTGR